MIMNSRFYLTNPVALLSKKLVDSVSSVSSMDQE